MGTEWRPVTDEPARGSVPPPWLASLPGIDRIHAWSKGLVLATPGTRLFGLHIGNVGPAAATVRMPASANFLATPHLDISPVVFGALVCAATTTIPAGFEVLPIVASKQFFRPPRPQPGSLLARSRALNASSVFVCAAVEVEDPAGRQVGHAVAQFAVRAVDPPPPAVPGSLTPVEEPIYSTPDPPDRPPVGATIPADVFQRHTGLEIVRMQVGGELPLLPIQHLMGLRVIEASEGECRVVMPASQWFCFTSRNVDALALEVLLEGTCSITTLTQIGAGQSVILLETSTRFIRPVLADGREVSARGRVRQRAGNVVFVESDVVDADGSLLETMVMSLAILEQRDRRPPEPERVLTTLLFTDIVGSTERAQRMGDAAWRALLSEHHALVRRELLAHKGREINTVGDGFLARFDSPASAVRCAKAIRDGVRRLNLEIRAGVHTGECEIQGADLAGIALHVAARIVALAGANEIVVSQMVKDLAGGSGLRFVPLGSHTLKGIEGEWAVFAVEDS